jgi:hypothetical protein
MWSVHSDPTTGHPDPTRPRPPRPPRRRGPRRGYHLAPSAPDPPPTGSTAHKPKISPRARERGTTNLQGGLLAIIRKFASTHYLNPIRPRDVVRALTMSACMRMRSMLSSSSGFRGKNATMVKSSTIDAIVLPRPHQGLSPPTDSDPNTAMSTKRLPPIPTPSQHRSQGHKRCTHRASSSNPSSPNVCVL